MKRFPAVIYYPVQWTWGIIQNLTGLVIFLANADRPHFGFRNSVATVWKRDESLSMGMFIFLSENLKGEATEEGSELNQVAVHEYGHTFQSMILGPLYLPAISAPSGLWCMVPGFEKMRKNRKISYYKLYTERWANHLGRIVTNHLPCGYWETHSFDKRRKPGTGQKVPPEQFRKGKE